MKNKHADLSESSFRDSISRIYMENRFYGENETNLKRIDDNIKKLIEEREKVVISIGIIDIIKLKGWKFIDDSDICEDYNREDYFSFLGTDDEFKKVYKIKE